MSELQDESRYVKLLDAPLSEMMPFLTEHLRRTTRVTVAFYSLLLSSSAATGGLVALQSMRGDFGAAFAQIGWAVIASVPLIPAHELVHGLTFKFFGARDVRYAAVWKQLMFFAGAHNFVVGGRAFAWVAVMPFLIINAAFVLLAVVAPEIRIFSLATLTIHTLCCSGDIALLNCLWLRRGEKLYTYDDMDARRTYIYLARV